MDRRRTSHHRSAYGRAKAPLRAGPRPTSRLTHPVPDDMHELTVAAEHMATLILAVHEAAAAMCPPSNRSRRADNVVWLCR